MEYDRARCFCLTVGVYGKNAAENVEGRLKRFIFAAIASLTTTLATLSSNIDTKCRIWYIFIVGGACDWSITQ